MPDPSPYQALLVAVPNYAAPGLTALPVVQRDVSALRDALREFDYSVRTLGLDERPEEMSRNRISSAFHDACLGAKGAELLFLYFGGHGVHYGGRDYLVPYDAVLTHPKRFTDYLVSTDIADAVDESPAKTVLFVIDACREGVDLGLKSVGLTSWGMGAMGRAAKRAFILLFGCGRGEFCRYTDGNDGFSLFSRALVTTLKSAPAPRTIGDLVNATQSELNGLCAHHKLRPQTIHRGGEVPVPHDVLGRLIRKAAPLPPQPPRPAGGPPVAPSVPFLAPPRPPHDLVGRTTVLQNLKQQLFKGDKSVCAIQGLPGSGKTSVAIELANDPEVREHFGDGILWAGLGRSPDVLSLLGTWSVAVGISPEALAKLSGVVDRVAAVRAVIGPRHMLLVVDDAWPDDLESALAFRLGCPNCVCLVTTRSFEVALAFAPENGAITALPELDTDDRLTLLARLAPGVVSAEPDEARALVGAVGGLPLAVSLVGGYLRKETYSGQPRRLRAALTRMHQATERLRLTQPTSPAERPSNLPRDAPLSLMAAIGVSEEALPPEGRTALRALAVFPPKPNTFSEEAALMVAAIDGPVLDRLVDHGLVESTSPGRYALHQTIADYAAAKQPDATSSRGRLVEFFARFAAATRFDYKGIDPERVNILAALSWFADPDQLPAADRVRLWRRYVELTDAVVDYLWARGYWEERAVACERGFHACRTVLGDPAAAGRQAYSIGWVHWQRRDLPAARKWADECRRCMEEAGEPEGVSLAKHLQGLVAMVEKEYATADTLFREALATVAAGRSGVGGRGSIMAELGHVCRARGNLVEAKDWYERCVRESEATGYTEGRGVSKGYLAQTLFLMGRVGEAEELYREALDVALGVGRATTVARTRRGLAEILVEKGELAEAREHLREVVPIYRRLGMREELEALQPLLVRVGDPIDQVGTST